MINSRVNFLLKSIFVVEILTNHGRGLLLFAAPCRNDVNSNLWHDFYVAPTKIVAVNY